MNLEGLARYIDAVAPVAPVAPAAPAGAGALGRQRSRRAVVATFAAALGLAAVTATITANQSSQPGLDPGESSSSTVDPAVPRLVVATPGGPSVAIQLADHLAIGPEDALVTHQVGATIDGYGYDATMYESVPVPFDPCPRSQPCTEVGAPSANADGLVLRSWAPVLVPGSEPASPTVLTVEAGGGAAVLVVAAVYDGSGLSSSELVSSLAYESATDGPGSFTAVVGGQDHPFAWVGTMVQPQAPGITDWILLVAPDCEGADRCESGVGLSSLVTSGVDRVPIDELVVSVAFGG